MKKLIFNIKNLIFVERDLHRNTHHRATRFLSLNLLPHIVIGMHY
jgi:hypothetical protein